MVHWIITGAIAGWIASVGLTAARWLTAAPYVPLLLPYDAGLCAAVGAVGFGLAGALGIWHDRAARALAALVPATVLLRVWQNEMASAGGGRLLVWAALAVPLVGLVWSLVRKRDNGWPIGWFCLALALSLPLALLGLALWWPLGLLLPLVAAAVLAVGVPRIPSVTSPAAWAPVACAALVAVLCSSTIYPASSQRVSTAVDVAPSSGRSVILIVLDTLRADHMSLYGYRRRTTPNIDRWAREGLVFDRSSAVSCWTLPVHASIFTGLFPRSHGAHGHRGTTEAPAAEAAGGGNPSAEPTPSPGRRRRRHRPYVLARQRVTLAELATAAGRATAAVAANHVYLKRAYQLDQGFTNYWVGVPHKGVTFLPSERLAERFSPRRLAEFRWPFYRGRFVTDNAIRWLRAARGRPFFLFVNYMDVHSPNSGPPTPEVPLPPDAPVWPPKFDCGAVWAGQDLDPAIRRDLIDRYDRELIYLDRQLQRLFAYLERSGLAATTTVIVTSDHGEYFGEHHLTGHSRHLYEQVTHVPLVMRGPGIPAGRSSRPVQSVDIFPTVLQLLEVPYAGPMQGHSLLGKESADVVAEWYAWPGTGIDDPHAFERFNRDLRTLKHGSYKLFADDRGRFELFNLQHDPGELHDLSGQQPRIVGKLRTRLDAWLAQHPAATDLATPQDITEQLQQLRALGYVD